MSVADEPLCLNCKEHEGLCHFHELHVLPQEARPSWIRWIGDPYVCTNPECADHRLCNDVKGHPAPRAECGCHSCSQRRWARARAAEVEEPSADALKAERRNERKRKKAAEIKAKKDAERKAREEQARRAKVLNRLARGVRGEFTVTRHKRSAA